MKKLKIILTFIYCRAGDLVKITRRILDSLRNNAQFPNPTPALDEIDKALEEYLVSLSNAGGRDREKVAIKDSKQAALRELLLDLAHYVTQTCKGDKAMFLVVGLILPPKEATSKDYRQNCKRILQCPARLPRG
jgi:hypothetical protein